MKYTSQKQSKKEIKTYTKKYTEKIDTLSSIKLTSLSNSKIDHKDVFSNNNQIAKNIVFLKKISFDVFFSKAYKYPLLIREDLNLLKNADKNINREKYGDHWENNTLIPLENQYTIDDYAIYKYYGGSEGHMAPASFHKLNKDDYYETFLFSNVIPQNLIMNIGIWNILENWCKKSLYYNPNIYNINIFTGCIVDNKVKTYYNALLEKLEMNIPTDMYKIITFNNKEYPEHTFFDIIIMKNKEYDINININNNKIDLKKYILPIKLYNWFQIKTGINIKKLLLFYNINTYNLKSFQNSINIKYNPNKIPYFKETYLFYFTLYKSTSIEELYNNLTILNNIDNIKYNYNNIVNPINNYTYNNLFFYKLRNKLIRDKLLYTKFKSLKEFNSFFNNYKNKLINNYEINKNAEIVLLNINQEDYLNNYYTIMKNKLK
jgi:DNA/RNA endonuclease G (NUC1)